MKELSVQKVKIKLWNNLVKKMITNKAYPIIYKSYWKKILSSKENHNVDKTYFYLGSTPNPGAGVGHQMANWIAGLWYAKQFNLKFVHFPFSNEKWEKYLGFGYGEKTLKELINEGYKSVKLPKFDGENEKKFIESIISSYSGKKIVFVTEQDQYYKAQYGVIKEIKNKFNKAPIRKTEKLIYESNNFNLAIHVRRTVIIDSKVIEEDEETRAKRWLSNDYYEKVLLKVLENLQTEKPVVIHIFSTAKADEFLEFSKYGKVVFCNDLNEYESFLHLVRADLLITSKSSFSYKPALLSDGIKVCPKNFWHGYPESKDWILVDNEGEFDIEQLKKI